MCLRARAFYVQRQTGVTWGLLQEGCLSVPCVWVRDPEGCPTHPPNGAWISAQGRVPLTHLDPDYRDLTDHNLRRVLIGMVGSSHLDIGGVEERRAVPLENTFYLVKVVLAFPILASHHHLRALGRKNASRLESRQGELSVPVTVVSAIAGSVSRAAADLIANDDFVVVRVAGAVVVVSVEVVGSAVSVAIVILFDDRSVAVIGTSIASRGVGIVYSTVLHMSLPDSVSFLASDTDDMRLLQALRNLRSSARGIFPP